MKSHSIVIDGQKTSVSFEDAFWNQARNACFATHPCRHSRHVGSVDGIYLLLRFAGTRMRFTEINLLGVYVAPITLIMAAAWLLFVLLRRVTDRLGLLRNVWHPALFELAVYVILVYCITVLIAPWSS